VDSLNNQPNLRFGDVINKLNNQQNMMNSSIAPYTGMNSLPNAQATGAAGGIANASR